MSTWAWIGVGLVAWLILGAVFGVFVGKVMSLNDRNTTRGDDSTPARNRGGLND